MEAAMFWRDLAQLFRSLPSASTLRAEWSAEGWGEERGNWYIAGGSDSDISLFQSYAKRGVVLLRPESQDHKWCRWLDCLREDASDFRVNKNGGGGAGADGQWHNFDAGRVRRVCEASARFCEKRETEALEQQAKVARGKAVVEAIGGGVREKAHSWPQVEIRFLSEWSVQERVNGRWRPTQTCTEMGFADKRTDKPNRAWGVLIGLARHGGAIPCGKFGGDAEWKRLQKRMQEIRKTLRRRYGRQDDPVPYVKRTGYKTQFKITLAPSFER